MKEAGAVMREAGEGVVQLLAAETGRQAKDVQGEHLKKIEKRFGVTEVTANPSAAINQIIINEIIAGTGNWLKEVREFRSWEDRKAQVDPVLCLKGSENVGKTFLTSAIIRMLQTRYGHEEQGSSRTSIAYHFFPKGSEKAKDKPQYPETALKSMSWQIARNDIVYRKEMACLCDEDDCPDFLLLGWVSGSLARSKAWFLQTRRCTLSYF